MVQNPVNLRNLRVVFLLLTDTKCPLTFQTPLNKNSTFLRKSALFLRILTTFYPITHLNKPRFQPNIKDSPKKCPAVPSVLRHPQIPSNTPKINDSPKNLAHLNTKNNFKSVRNHHIFKNFKIHTTFYLFLYNLKSVSICAKFVKSVANMICPIAKKYSPHIIRSMAKNQRKIITVTQLNSLIKGVLESNLPSRIILAGEISTFKPHGSGHCYFSMKDQGSTIPCVMWRSKVKNLKFNPENGMAVLATGYVDVYEPGGKYQYYVDKLEPAGIGDLQLAFEQMVKRLESEGLFKDQHKQPIPSYPMRIAILTSESGAAVMDITDSIYNRWPCAELLLFPVPVQGDGAAEKIAAALNNINKRNSKLKIDVAIVGRGGGSLEDLWAFNEEILARSIFASKIPIISAVGHEVDITIADLVADARASTPTKAGVIAVPDMAEVLERLYQAQNRLAMSAVSRFEIANSRLETITASALFRNPDWMTNQAAQQLDESAMSLTSAAKQIFADLKDSLIYAARQIQKIEPHRLMGDKKVELANYDNSIINALSKIITKSRLQLTAVENRLGALDPRSVLGRGYSITTSKKTGKVITKTGDIAVGDVIVTELAEKSRIESEVKNTD